MSNTNLKTNPDSQQLCRQRHSKSMNQTTTPQPEPLNDVLDIAALALLLHIHRVTATLKAQAGEIPGRQIGNRWRFSRSKIMSWLETSA